jgi:hypothetical protein
MNFINNILEIKTGDALLVGGHSFLAEAIQEFENCKFNHAGMFYWCYDELFVIEADKPGVVLTHFDEYIKGKSHLLVCKPDFAVDGVEYGKFMLPLLGRKRYGFFNLLIAQPIKFLTNGRIWLGSNADDPGRFICGQFVEYVYNHFNEDMFPNWKRDAPSDIFNNYHFKHYLFQR